MNNLLTIFSSAKSIEDILNSDYAQELRQEVNLPTSIFLEKFLNHIDNLAWPEASSEFTTAENTTEEHIKSLVNLKILRDSQAEDTLLRNQFEILLKHTQKATVKHFYGRRQELYSYIKTAQKIEAIALQEILFLTEFTPSLDPSIKGIFYKIKKENKKFYFLGTIHELPRDISLKILKKLDRYIEKVECLAAEVDIPTIKNMGHVTEEEEKARLNIKIKEKDRNRKALFQIYLQEIQNQPTQINLEIDEIEPDAEEKLDTNTSIEESSQVKLLYQNKLKLIECIKNLEINKKKSIYNFLIKKHNTLNLKLASKELQDLQEKHELSMVSGIGLEDIQKKLEEELNNFIIRFFINKEDDTIPHLFTDLFKNYDKLLFDLYLTMNVFDKLNKKVYKVDKKDCLYKLCNKRISLIIKSLEKDSFDEEFFKDALDISIDIIAIEAWETGDFKKLASLTRHSMHSEIASFLLDKRDKHMAKELEKLAKIHDKIFVAVGSAHTEGIIDYFQQKNYEIKQIDLSQIA